jgi:hypothetical protein
MWKANGRTTDAYPWQKLTWPMARWAKNRPIRNKNCLWWPCLLMNRDEMSNLYKGPSKDAPYQVSIHLAKRFHRRGFFRNQPIRNNNDLWWPCLLTDRDKTSIVLRGPSIDASYQVSLHLAEGFQRRRLKCEKLTGRRHTTNAKWWRKRTLPLARWAKKMGTM